MALLIPRGIWGLWSCRKIRRHCRKMCLLCKQQRLFRVRNPCCCCSLQCGTLWVAIVSTIYGGVSMVLPYTVGISLNSSQNETEVAAYTRALVVSENMENWIHNPQIVVFSHYGCYIVQIITGAILGIGIICRLGGMINFFIGCLWMIWRCITLIFWIPIIYAILGINNDRVDDAWTKYCYLLLINIIFHFYAFVVIRYYTMECWDIWLYRPREPGDHDRMRLQRRHLRKRRCGKCCGLIIFYSLFCYMLKCRCIFKCFRHKHPHASERSIRRRKCRCTKRAIRHKWLRFIYRFKWRNIRRCRTCRRRKKKRMEGRKARLNHFRRKQHRFHQKYDYYETSIPIWDLRNGFIIRGEDYSSMDPIRHYRGWERMEASGILELGRANVFDEVKFRQLVNQQSDLFVPLEHPPKEARDESPGSGRAVAFANKFNQISDTRPITQRIATKIVKIFKPRKKSLELPEYTVENEMTKETTTGTGGGMTTATTGGIMTATKTKDSSGKQKKKATKLKKDKKTKLKKKKR